MAESDNIIYYLSDTLDLYFYITDENDVLIAGADWDAVEITIKDDFNATAPVVVLADHHAGEFTTYEEDVTPGNVHFFMSAANLALLTEGVWEYRVVLILNADGETPAERVTAASGKIYGK